MNNIVKKFRELLEEADPTNTTSPKKTLLLAIGGVGVGILLMVIIVIIQNYLNFN